MNRRDFLAAAASSALAGGCRLLSGRNGYSVAVLGDTHYDSDRPETYHRAFMQTEEYAKYPWFRSEFARNGALWAKEGPARRLLAASARSVGADAAFVVQLGDLVQGDCDSFDLHVKMLTDMGEVLKSSYPAGMRFYTVCGNHDLRRGAKFDVRKAYLSFSERLHGKKGANFHFLQGPDAWIFLDFNDGPQAFKYLKRALSETGGVRYTFVLTHGPVLPMGNWRKRFFLLGHKDHSNLRREARALLARRQAIVLAGHEHILEHRDWFGDGGRITEFIFNSIWGESLGKPNPAEPKVIASDPSEFDRGDCDGLYAEYVPGLKVYWAAYGVGHYRLNVSDDGVSVDYFGRDSTSVTKSFVLRRS